MITLYCALYPEARELIRVFQLKKESGQKRFPVFSDRERGIRLVITGVGAIAAATAVAEISSRDLPTAEDLLVNYGSCASADGEPGEVYLCNKLTDAQTGRAYYPDVFPGHPFEEAEVVTAAKAIADEGERSRTTAESGLKEAVRLYDMEAAAVYQAGNYYYGPHRMIFLKAVTEHGVSAEKIVPFLAQLCQSESGKAKRIAARLRQEARADADRLGELLHCTEAMRRELEQLLYYRRLTGYDYGEWVQERLSDGRLPAKDKREGKRLFEEFKAQSCLHSGIEINKIS